MGVFGSVDIPLSRLLKEKHIQPNLKGRNKAEIITELVQLVAGKADAKRRRLLSSAIAARERLGSTAIGAGVAIPHAKIAGINKPILAFGRAPLGVDFNSLDGEKTYIFFMLLSPEREVGGHLKILAKISHLTRDRFAVRRLKKLEIKKEILSLLAYLEKNSSNQ